MKIDETVDENTDEIPNTNQNVTVKSKTLSEDNAKFSEEMESLVPTKPESPRNIIQIPPTVPQDFHVLNDAEISDRKMLDHVRQILVN